MPTSIPSRSISSIKMSRRHRKALGDIPALAANINDVGLLHPVVIQSNGQLIAGARRLAACKYLGWKKIPVRTIDMDKIVLGEYAENVFRKDLLPSEAVAIARTLRPLEETAAQERQAATGGKGRFASGKLPQAIKGRAGDKIARVTGISRRTLEKAEMVVAAAKANPRKYGKLLEVMDRTGRVNGVHRLLQISRAAETIRKEKPSLPRNGQYRVIVVDPPWPYSNRDNDPSHRGRRPYPSMSIEKVCKLNVPSLLARDAIVWLWTPSYHLISGDASKVLAAWDLVPKTLLTWVKDRMGNGDWLRNCSEHCILSVRGRPVVTLKNQTTILEAPRRSHSEKPPEFYRLVETLCPAGRYLDVFSRYRHNDKWDCYGNDIPHE
jgi:N6-adenosine-specific RNA methylase IME4/ParB-like chromosome segregation protein Spo0J